MIEQWAILLVGLILLGFSSERVVRNAIRISERFRISSFLIGFILIAVLTNVPEFIIGLISAFESENTLVLGTIMGSNIAEILWVFGLVLIVANGFAIKRSQVLDHALLALFFVSVAMVFWWSNGVSWLEGLFLVAFFVYYFINVTRLNLMSPDKTFKTEWLPPKRTNLSPVLQFFVFLGILIASAQLITTSAINIANGLMLPTAVIGTLLAIGTTVPDLAISLQAVRKKGYDIAMGNILGSCITNFTLILGISAIISPVPYFEQSLITIPIFFLFLASILLAYSIMIATKLPRMVGIIFVALYLVFLFFQVQTIF